MFTRSGLENGKGSSADLMPSIMGAFDAIIENENNKKETVRRAYQAGNFANLSPGVQKLLSNLPDRDINKNFSSEENLGCRKLSSRAFRSFRSHSDRIINRSDESLEIISPNVQKMLSNLPDTELIPTVSNLNMERKVNRSFLHNFPKDSNGTSSHLTDVSSCGVDLEMEIHNTFSRKDNIRGSCAVDAKNTYNLSKSGIVSDNSYHKPLGSYLHTSPHGIASRTPVGRKFIGKHIQNDSGCSLGIGSTNSIGTPCTVSTSSLGSSSSMYLTSAEDSDHDRTDSQGSADSGIIVDQSKMTPELKPLQKMLGSADSGIAEQTYSSVLGSIPDVLGSADSGIAEPTAISSELRVLQEVVDTETTYVSDLREVIKGYLEPWRLEENCLLGPHLQDLFSNIEEVYQFNRLFLDQLRLSDYNATKMANVFLQNNAGFSVYNEYCTNYPRTMEAIAKLTQNEEMVPLFKEKQLKLGHALPLGSYLLKPVQRILKYRLLLQRLSKQFEPNHNHVVDLALKTMTGVASEINDMKRKHEQRIRVQEIQSQLYGWEGPDLTALGDLIAEGTFAVIDSKGHMGDRHILLFDKVLIMTKERQGGVLAYKCHIMCSILMLVEQVRGDKLSFQVLPYDNPRLQCTLKAGNKTQKMEWTSQIKKVMLENFDIVIPNHARQLVMELGQDLPETDDVNDKWSPLKLYPNYSSPHYLERRSKVRKGRDLPKRRAASQDRSLTSLSSWRRKSEPSMNSIPQFLNGNKSQKISKSKKTKECGSTSTFYTNLSDSENCDAITESCESLHVNDKNISMQSFGSQDIQGSTTTMNMAKIVEDIVIEEFNKRRHIRDSEPNPTIWFEEHLKLPAKADSLPRFFLLNDKIEPSVSNTILYNNHVLDKSLKEDPDFAVEDQQYNNDLNTSLDHNDHPEHKMYRKAFIRLSVLHRLRKRMFDTHKKSFNYPSCKQGSKSMGEKIAHPDYVDPQSLFLYSLQSSSSNLTIDHTDTDCDILGEHERLDMTISETDVLTEVEKRLEQNSILEEHFETILDTGQNCLAPASPDQKLISHKLDVNNSCNSSQEDSYYESLLDNCLKEEYIKDESGKLVLKQDSFRNIENNYLIKNKFRERTEKESRSPIVIKNKELYNHEISFLSRVTNDNKTNTLTDRRSIRRPTNAPPPIPIKPTRFLNGNKFSTKTIGKHRTTINVTNSINNRTIVENQNGNPQSTTSTNGANTKSWVKAMVGRFE